MMEDFKSSSITDSSLLMNNEDAATAIPEEQDESGDLLESQDNVSSSPPLQSAPKDAAFSEAVLRCVFALEQATTTETKIVALFMVTKVLKAETLDDGAKMKLFDAIGQDFLTGLLRDESESSEASMFKSIALSILTCFVTIDHRKSFFHNLIPDFLSIISDLELHANNLTIIQDAFQCLTGIVAHKSGVKAFNKEKGLDCLVDIYVQENFCQQYSLNILMQIMRSEGANTWLQAPAAFTKLADHACKEFSSIHTERKFELCTPLAELLHSMPDSVPGDDGYEWQRLIHKGLCDILLSKLGKDQRCQGLNLGAAALDSLGATWVVAGGNKGHQLLLIMVHFACIEVRMSLENKTFEEAVELGSQTVSCYSILENAIKFLVNGALEMEEKQKQQLYAALKGAFNAVLTFLKDASEEKVHTSNKATQMFVCATIRVLGAWLAEETAANKEEVYEILPLIVGMARYNFKWNKKVARVRRKKVKCSEHCEKLPDLLRFLLPGLCHLTAEDEPRFTLIELGIEDFLIEYFVLKAEALQSLIDSKKDKCAEGCASSAAAAHVESLCDTLVTLCSIFMNIVVTSPLEVQTKSIYLSLLSLIFVLVADVPQDGAYLPLCGNLCILGLMILKHQFKNVRNSKCGIFRFVQSTVRFLWDAHNVEESQDYATLVVSLKYHRLWNDLMELWFLGMHNLMLLLAQIPWLCDFLLECDWPQTVVRTLGQVREDGVEGGLRTALEDMLCMIVRCSPPAKRALRQTDADRIAKLHHMDELVIALQQ